MPRSKFTVVPATCANCGKIEYLWPSEAKRRKFCSLQCTGIYKQGKCYKPMEGRFWSHVEKTETCWLWRGTIISSGYGTLSVGGSNKHAHRLSYELHHGPIPKGMFCCHQCDTPACVRPDHLFLGTTQDNTADKTAKGRQAKGEGHGMSKLTEAQVLEIRRLSAEGCSAYRLARMFSVSEWLVRDIIKRKYWKHI